MAKVFEDYFSELQADMVSICLEYVENKADNIFIYCSNEERSISCNYFFKINGKIVKKHKLNDAIDENSNFKYDTSIERQKGVTSIINDNMKKIQEVCTKYNKEIPTEMKLIYDVKKNSLKADYKYDLIYTNTSDKTPIDISLEWFEEIKKSG